jgi:hypothetical protein
MAAHDEKNQSGDEFAYLETMNEMLELLLYFIEEARQAPDERRLGNNLKIASRVLRNALELHLARLKEEV